MESQASVVLFDKNSINTKFCASGKCYESLFVKTPILASENPPLKRLCEQEGIGVSNDNFYEGIKTLENNYDYYVKNVENYLLKLDYDNRLKVLEKQILSVIK